MAEQAPGEEFRYPAFRLEFDGEEIVLHWFNSLVRTFKDPQYQHIEWTDNEGGLHGVKAAQGLMDLLFENEFPYRFDPIPDEATQNWLVMIDTKNLDAELYHLSD